MVEGTKDYRNEGPNEIGGGGHGIVEWGAGS